jgi:hypothetical protein
VLRPACGLFAIVAVGLCLLCVSEALAQEPGREQSSQPTPVGSPQPAPSQRRADLLLPLGSLLVPGLGLWFQHAPARGLVYQGVFLGGWVGSHVVLDGKTVSIDDLDTFDGPTELGAWFRQLSGDAGFLSAYDSFHRSLPALQKSGKYTFLTEPDAPGALLKAPGELHFLKQKSTYVPVALAVALSFAGRVAGPEAGREFVPVRGRDAAFSAGLSYNAGVGEEALYRGYLMPLLQQRLGGRARTANGLQAAVFAAGHGDFSPLGFASHFGFGIYAGYLANRNRGSLRQNVFNHFLWDVVAVSGSLLTRQRDRDTRERLPNVVITF